MTRIDPADVARLRELERLASPGPLPEPGDGVVVRFEIYSDADARLFFAARNALPALLDAADAAEVLAHAIKGATAENEALRAENERLRGLLERAVKYAREDRAQTPGVTRLARVLAEAEKELGK
jgi:hypothetical protein